jgi:GTP-binding protein Era
VGKSTLLNALLGERIAITSPHPQTTRDTLLGILTVDGATLGDDEAGPTQFLFVDTPGVHNARTKLGSHMNHVAKDALVEADVVVFLTSLGRDHRPPTAPALSSQEQAILKAAADGKPVICVINKIDLLADKAELLPRLQGYMDAFPFRAIVPVSAREKDGVKNVLRAVREHLPESPLLYPDDELSDRPLRFFVSEFVREQVLRKTREEVPHGVAVVVDRYDEGGKMPRIDVSIHVDKESHKGIIIGAAGQQLKAIGSDARARVEAMVGRQVHLQLWVRVTPGWYQSDSALREMGYGQADGEPGTES